MDDVFGRPSTSTRSTPIVLSALLLAIAIAVHGWFGYVTEVYKLNFIRAAVQAEQQQRSMPAPLPPIPGF
jgi:hypothetical protein